MESCRAGKFIDEWGKRKVGGRLKELGFSETCRLSVGCGILSIGTISWYMGLEDSLNCLIVFITGTGYSPVDTTFVSTKKRVIKKDFSAVLPKSSRGPAKDRKITCASHFNHHKCN